MALITSDFVSGSELSRIKFHANFRLGYLSWDFNFVKISAGASGGKRNSLRLDIWLHNNGSWKKKTQKLLFYGGAGEMFHENQFDQENMFYNALVCWIAIPIDLNSPFSGLYYTEKRLWYQQFLLRQLSVFRGGSPIVEFDATVMYRLYVTTMKEMNIQEDFPLLPIDNFKHHHMVALDLTSKQDVVEILQNLENKLENHWDWS